LVGFVRGAVVRPTIAGDIEMLLTLLSLTAGVVAETDTIMTVGVVEEIFGVVGVVVLSVVVVEFVVATIGEVEGKGGRNTFSGSTVKVCGAIGPYCPSL